jgi:hypothetical protein
LTNDGAFVDWILSLHWKWFFIRLIVLVVVAPLIGMLLVDLLQRFESTWKTKEKKKRWKACCLAFISLAITLCIKKE